MLARLVGVEFVSGRAAALRVVFEDIPYAIDNFHVKIEELTDLARDAFSSWRDISVAAGEAASS